MRLKGKISLEPSGLKSALKEDHCRYLLYMLYLYLYVHVHVMYVYHRFRHMKFFLLIDGWDCVLWYTTGVHVHVISRQNFCKIFCPSIYKFFL